MQYLTDVCDRCKEEFTADSNELTSVSLIIGASTSYKSYSFGGSTTVYEPFKRELCKECCRELGFARTIEEFKTRQNDKSPTRHLTTIELMDEAIRNYVTEIISEQANK